MKIYYKVLSIIGIFFLFTPFLTANWIKSENNMSFTSKDRNTLITQITQNTQHTQDTQNTPHSNSDSLPAGITNEMMKDLRDENGNRVFSDDEGDAMQQTNFNGFGTSDSYGAAVSSAGDVNGDGYDDIIVGAPNNDAAFGNAGRAYIYFGGITTNNTADVILSGEAASNVFGTSVSSAGDVNGDGYADVIVGALGYSSNIGRAYIFYGGSAMNGTADVTMNGGGTNFNFGADVSTAGDVNGDGYSDVIVGAWGYLSNTGRAYIFYGGVSMDNSSDVVLTGEVTGNRFGTSVSNAGDVNGDGYSDVIVGAFNYVTSTGRAYIYYGGAAMDNTADVTMTGEAVSSNFGYSVSGGGDINGDGYSDVIVGAYGYNSNQGRVYVFYGGAAMNNLADVTMTGEAAGNFFGNSVSIAGDVNGDGYSDIISGAYQFNSTTGRTYLFFGGSSMNIIADITFNGEATNNDYGISVSGAGDINGDGYSDLVTGADLYNSVGRAYVYTNTMNGDDIADLTMNGAVVNNHFGSSVSSAGDVNGDGYPDVIVGAYTFSSNTGRAYIFFGGSSMDNVADVTLSGEATNNYFGSSVSTAGDVNGDGISDVIVGAEQYSSGTGRAYIFLGGTSMDAIADVTMTGEAAGISFGRSVSDAGDVNGDGYADVIIGASTYSSSAGRVYIYFGGSAMNNVSDLTITGSTGSYLGESVSSAGDVNGDNYSDVIAGAPVFSSSKGRIFIYYGGSAMNNTADVTLTGEAASNSLGISVSGAGDVNKDGYADVIAGASGYDGSNGRAYILYGGLSMDSVADVIMTSTGSFGGSVSRAGDVNGDGYSDVIAGASGFNLGTGRALIFYGGSSMNNVADVTMTGETTTSGFGISVSDAGDVNGDGLSDVIAGADGFNSFAGRSYLYMSSAPSVKPNIQYVRDVANDQGGYVNVRWSRSGYDISGLNTITQYILERSLPPGGGGYAWQTVATVNATLNSNYIFAAQTLSDSGAGNNTFFFRVTAKTADNNVFWRSNIMSGFSIDNLAPFAPLNLAATPLITDVSLNWDQNLETDLHHYLIYRNGVLIATSVYSNYIDTTAIEDSTYSYNTAAVDIHGNISSFSNTAVISINQFGNIDLTLIMEGYYDAGLNNMRLADTVSIYLRNSSSPYLIVDSSRAVINAATFTGSFNMLNASTGNYFIAVKQRNTIETWSSSPVSYTAGGVTHYNFTTASAKAFGNNMKQIDASPVRFGIFSGDVNQDGFINLTDIISIYNDAGIFVTGYNVTDVNGDNISDLTDVIIANNNSNNFVSRIRP